MSGDGARIAKVRRLGFGRACSNCRQKKHRCDGLKPQCSGCLSRGLFCTYLSKYVEGEWFIGWTCLVADDSFRKNASLDKSAIRNASTLSSGRRTNPVNEVSSLATPQDHSPNVRGTVSGSPDSMLYNHCLSTPVHGRETSAELMANPANEPSGYFGDSSAFKFVSGVRDELRQQAMTNLDSDSTVSVQESATNIASLTPGERRRYDMLPPRKHADDLVDAYFERVHLLYPFIHEPTFRNQYECLWADRTSCEVAWLAVANMVFAYGCEFNSSNGELDCSERASPYVGRAKSIILSHVFEDFNLHLTQGMLLLCHYLQGALKLNECWNFFGLTIRSAMSIGLHIDPMNDHTLSPTVREARKRLWWGCFVLDRTLSMKFGRPPSIILANALDVDFPSEVDDQYIVDSVRVPRQPSNKPSKLCTFVQTIKLSFVIDKILSMLYLKQGKAARKSEESGNIKEQYAVLGNIVLLDGQLQTWWDNVPSHLKITPEISDGIDAQRQRHVIYLRYLQMRLLLQRPSMILLAKNDFPDDYLKALATACAQRCIAMARETIQEISLLYHKQLLHSVWYLLHYVFCSLGVLLTAQMLGLCSYDEASTAQDTVIVKSGMAFLRSVSEHGSLARRYVMLLERYYRSAGENEDMRSSDTVESETPNGMATDAVYPQVHREPDAPHAALPALEHLGSDHMLANMNFPDPNGFLFGLGLPEEFLTTDWPFFEPRISL
ncbi:uncharacterized protein Z519_08962 [Cladophialophora bantiana CBS 173.52]|uniref:Zn(2)-C6 fungal-type domain-containing protein n=1 Tax=Cladophialophora bantiana (strain ATCC 10958 / CBS 173.52 / CDC B-1940 / NIH 8579) TaxID=1442370 RepID=A0A0D2HAL5_CLAB1|nr:uncharacterized protein Z519_08962 [Cladophialophora bantiana CBS 173.52]KIW90318.1 hypothetical protein Z519_08962 [Cladophialophora bantiana CBS 173.52]